MKSYLERPTERLGINEKVEIEFYKYSIDDVYQAQQEVNEKMTDEKKEMYKPILTLRAIVKETREQIRAYIPNIIFKD